MIQFIEHFRIALLLIFEILPRQKAFWFETDLRLFRIFFEIFSTAVRQLFDKTGCFFECASTSLRQKGVFLRQSFGNIRSQLQEISKNKATITEPMPD